MKMHMDKKLLLRRIGIGLGAVLFFLALSYGFVPQVLRGEIVNQSDISGYIGMSHEMDAWNQAHPDDPTYWTGSMFSGMPTTAISTRNTGDWTQKIYDLLLTGKRPATYLFIALLGAFLLMLSLGIEWWLALGGAVAVAFCSYNFQIIQVGHNTKMQAIAFLPWVLAAVVFTYRKALEKRERWLPQTVLGAALFGLALSMQIKANHQQVTYYLAIIVLLYALVLLIDILVKNRKAFARFAVASALLLVLGGVGIATNVNKLLPLYKYQAHTMRGGSELSGEGNNAKGLDISYATAWSYGWEELPNLMIPNYNGGASSAAVNPDKSATVALLRRAGQGNLRETAKHLPMYWGPQPFTAGPMYMGAISVFLFLLGLFLYRGREKWWLLVATLLAVLMAVGNHFLAFTKLCFAILPLYSKFRTVSMALIILQFTLPMLGFLALDRALKGDYPAKEIRKKGLVAYALTAGFCLIMWLVPTLAGGFTGAADAGQPDVLVDAFIADRKMLFRQDAITSFLLISAAFLLLLWAVFPKGQTEHAREFARAGRRPIAGIALSFILAVNLFAVGKRYLNDADFTTPKDFRRPFAERPVDKMIRSDEAPSYRVLDLTVNVFNSSVPSYHHKSVGGYSPAKLQRYQDLIDRYLNKEISAIYGALGDAKTLAEAQAALPATPVLNALNTKYIILGADNAPLCNNNALGPVWFVDGTVTAATPDDEIARLGTCNLARTAILGADFAGPARAGSAGCADGAGSEAGVNGAGSASGVSSAGSADSASSASGKGSEGSMNGADSASGANSAGSADSASSASGKGSEGAGEDRKTAAAVPTRTDCYPAAAGAHAESSQQPARIASSADAPEEGLPERDLIELTEYAPNALRYHYRAATERLAVFSEVYYPGWNGYLVDETDGAAVMKPFSPAGEAQPVDILRADWTLRAAVLPAGEHDLVMRFEPTSYRTGARISRASSILLILLVLASLAGLCFAAAPRRDT